MHQNAQTMQTNCQQKPAKKFLNVVRSFGIATQGFPKVTDNQIFLNPHVQLHCNICFSTNSLAKDHLSATLCNESCKLEHRRPMSWSHGLLTNKDELLTHLSLSLCSIAFQLVISNNLFTIILFFIIAVLQFL